MQVMPEIPKLTDVEFNEAVSAARAGMVFQAPYFATLAFNLAMKQGGKDVPIVDGQSFQFPPAFIVGSSPEELKGAVAAGSLACGLGHPFRMGGRKQDLWSRASAMICGQAVLDAGFQLPAAWPLDSRITTDISIEEGYRILEEEQTPEDGDGEGEGGGGTGGGGGGGGGGQQDQDGDGGGGGGMDVQPPQQKPPENEDDGDGESEGQPKDGGQGQQPRPMPQDQQRKMEQDWAVRMVQAAQTAEKMQGSIPGWMKGILDELTSPKVDWRQVLRQFLEETSKDDYSFVRPSRRYSGDGQDGQFIFPGLYSEDKPRLILGMDYSGSVTKPERHQFMGELNTILEEFDINITVIFFDSVVHRVKVYSRDDLPIMDDSGYGGTMFSPPFEWVEENAEEVPTAMIVCSDMECSDFPANIPTFPVLWVSTQPVENVRRCWPNNEIPFGQVIEIDVPHGYGY